MFAMVQSANAATDKKFMTVQCTKQYQHPKPLYEVHLLAFFLICIWADSMDDWIWSLNLLKWVGFLVPVPILVSSAGPENQKINKK